MKVLSKDPLSWVVSPSLLKTGDRLDARAFHPKRVRTIQHLLRVSTDKKFRAGPLRSLARIIRKGIHPQSFGAQIVHVGVGNIDTGSGLPVPQKLNSADLQSLKYRAVPKQILFSRIRPYLNKVAVIPTCFATVLVSSEFFVLDPVDVSAYYLTAYLRSAFTLMQTVPLVTGSSRPRLQRSDIEDLLLVVADDQTLAQVESAISEADSDIRQAEQAEKELVEVTGFLSPDLKSYDFLTFAVGFEQISDRLDTKFYKCQAMLRDILRALQPESNRLSIDTLGNLSTNISNGATPPRNNYQSSGIPIVKVATLSNSGLYWDKVSYVEPSFHSANSRAHIRSQDILFVSSAHSPDAIASKVDIVEELPTSGAMIVGELCLVRPKVSEIDPWYLLWFLRSPLGRLQLTSIVWGETAHIYEDDVANITIVRPPRELQTRELQTKIANLVRRIETSRIHARSLLKKATALVEDVLRLADLQQVE